MNRNYGRRYYGNYGRRYYGGYGVYGGYAGYGYYDGDYYGYYGGGCGWLYANAVNTGDPYWWSRYNACIGY